MRVAGLWSQVQVILIECVAHIMVYAKIITLNAAYAVLRPKFKMIISLVYFLKMSFPLKRPRQRLKVQGTVLHRSFVLGWI